MTCLQAVSPQMPQQPGWERAGSGPEQAPLGPDGWAQGRRARRVHHYHHPSVFALATPSLSLRLGHSSGCGHLPVNCHLIC